MNDQNDSIGLIPAFTCVTWAGCVAVGLAGLLGPQMQRAPTSRPSDAVAEPVEVSLSSAPADTPMLAPSVDDNPSLLDAAPAATDSPPVTPTASLPGPADAFAVPMDGPAAPSSLARPAPVTARSTARRTDSTGSPNVVRQLTFGSGEGRQPAPEYPADAAFAGQQGFVGVLFSVDPSGQVTSAKVETGSGWPVLNQAAVDAVRDTWRFSPGPARTYRVNIQFRLNN